MAIITNHAVDRFTTRAHKDAERYIPKQEIKNEINALLSGASDLPERYFPQEVKIKESLHGRTKVKENSGLLFVIEKNEKGEDVVVTVLENKERRRRNRFNKHNTY